MAVIVANGLCSPWRCDLAVICNQDGSWENLPGPTDRPFKKAIPVSFWNGRKDLPYLGDMFLGA
jgi:hypothetical protein